MAYAPGLGSNIVGSSMYDRLALMMRAVQKLPGGDAITTPTTTTAPAPTTTTTTVKAPTMDSTTLVKPSIAIDRVAPTTAPTAPVPATSTVLTTMATAIPVTSTPAAPVVSGTADTMANTLTTAAPLAFDSTVDVGADVNPTWLIVGSLAALFLLAGRKRKGRR